MFQLSTQKNFKRISCGYPHQLTDWEYTLPCSVYRETIVNIQKTPQHFRQKSHARTFMVTRRVSWQEED